jgi:hypothetical protein
MAKIVANAIGRYPNTTYSGARANSFVLFLRAYATKVVNPKPVAK